MACCALTLPSRGRPTSGFAGCRPPLMSNVRALAAGAVTLSQSGAGRPRSERRANRGGTQTTLGASPCAHSELPSAPLKQANARAFTNRRAGLRAKCITGRGLRKVGFLIVAESHAPSTTGFALKSNSMQAHVHRSGTQPRVESVVGRRSRQAPSPAGGEDVAASENERPNPSIERTHNGGAQCLAPSRAVPPLCAAHVKR